MSSASRETDQTVATDNHCEVQVSDHTSRPIPGPNSAALLSAGLVVPPAVISIG